MKWNAIQPIYKFWCVERVISTTDGFVAGHFDRQTEYVQLDVFKALTLPASEFYVVFLGLVFIFDLITLINPVELGVSLATDYSPLPQH